MEKRLIKYCFELYVDCTTKFGLSFRFLPD